MSTGSFAKIDMSLDDIIKLNKKEKKASAATQKAKATGQRLTPAQRKRAEALKLKARKTSQLKGQKGPSKNFVGRRKVPAFKTNAAKRGNLARKNKVGLARGGKANTPKRGQFKQNQRPSTGRGSGAQQRGRLTASTTGRVSVQDRLGVRINNTQKNQRLKRQQLMNKNRRGISRQANQNTGRQATNTRTSEVRRNNQSQRNTAPRARNRQYNQQPRRPARQQTQRGGNQNRRRQQKTQPRNTSNFNNRQRQTNNNNRGGGRRGRGGFTTKRSERSVTLY